MRAAVPLALMLVPGMASAEPEVPRFTEESAALSTAYEGDTLYMVGGGVAAFDCSGDRFPELLFAGGAGPAGLYLNRSAAGSALVFEKLAGTGVEVEAVLGVYPLDIDSDGIMDLVLLRLGENLVLRGLGGCRFERANEDWGFDGGADWSSALAAIWERGRDWPTVAVGSYIDPAQEAFPWGSCTANRLMRGGAGRFEPAMALEPGHCALSILFTDWNASGVPALRVSNDREYYKGGQEQLWHLPPDGPPRLYTEAEGWKRLRIWGMGIAGADLNFDGFPEYYLTSMADQKLQVLKDPDAGVPDYADEAFRRGVTAHRPYMGGDLRPSTGWHAEFEDVNADGRMDIFVVKGNVAAMPDFAAADPNNLFLQRADGTFLEAGELTGVGSLDVGRGGAVVDLNLDGRLDIVATRRWQPAQVWRQEAGRQEAGRQEEGPGGNWVQLALRQPGANRDALGAVLEIRRGERVERREVALGGGHGGAQAGWLHIGLGRAAAAELRVIWPDGTAGDWITLPAGRFWDLSPGAAPVEWLPPTR